MTTHAEQAEIVSRQLEDFDAETERLELQAKALEAELKARLELLYADDLAIIREIKERAKERSKSPERATLRAEQKRLWHESRVDELVPGATACWEQSLGWDFSRTYTVTVIEVNATRTKVKIDTGRTMSPNPRYTWVRPDKLRDVKQPEGNSNA